MLNGSFKAISADGNIGGAVGDKVRIKGLVLTATSDVATATIYDAATATGTAVLVVKTAANSSAVVNIPFRLANQGYVALGGTSPTLHVCLE